MQNGQSKIKRNTQSPLAAVGLVVIPALGNLKSVASGHVIGAYDPDITIRHLFFRAYMYYKLCKSIDFFYNFTLSTTMLVAAQKDNAFVC